MNKRGSDGGGNGKIDGVSDKAEIVNMLVRRAWSKSA